MSRPPVRRRPLLALTSGDPNGIGPEVSLRALLDRRVVAACRPFLVGEPSVFEFYRRRFDLPLTLLPVETPPPSWGAGIVPVAAAPAADGFRCTPGRPTRAAGSAAGRAIERAAALWSAGALEGIVTGPVSKAGLHAAGYRHPGQTEMLAGATGARAVLMLMLSGPLRIGLATIHLPLRRVPRAITGRGLSTTIDLFLRSLRDDFGIRRPRLAVLALNPHAGEQGLLGTEEREVISPAIRAAARRGGLVTGPFPADGFFGSGGASGVDGVLAMYHDQGLIPLKMGGLASAVNFSAGLPLVRTSPGHGTAFAIAGRGTADPSSTVAAVLAASEIALRRPALRRPASGRRRA